MHNNALHVLDSTLAAAEPHDPLTWSEFLAQIPKTTSVTVGGSKYVLEKVGSNLHVVCDNDEVLTFAVINSNLDMLSHGNFVSSSNVREVLRKHKTKEELLRYLLGLAHNHCATAAAEPGVSYDIDEVIDTLQNHPKERFVGHGVTIFLDENGSVAFVTSKHGAGLGYVERGTGGKIKLRVNNTSETVAGRVTSMEHLAACIFTFAERVSGKALASAEPRTDDGGSKVYLNLRDLHEATLALIRQSGYLRVHYKGQPVIVAILYGKTISVAPRGLKRIGFEPSEAAADTLLYGVDAMPPLRNVTWTEIDTRVRKANTPKRYVTQLIAFTIKHFSQEATAAAEPGHSGFEDAAEAVETACRRYESSNSLGLDIEELEIDADSGSANIMLSTMFSMLDGEDGVIRAEFTYESGALTIHVADNVVINNKKMPFPNSDVWARMVSAVLAFLERVLVTERKRINTELQRVETDFTSGMSKLFKVRVGKPPIKLHVSWRTGNDAVAD